MTESWWIKFERAQHHRAEAETVIAEMLSQPTIRVEKSFDGNRWNYRVHHDVAVNTRLPAIIGDFLFDLRSALDHIIAANVARPNNSTLFPIYYEDFTTPAHLTQRLKSHADRWANLEKQLPRPVFKVLELAQPFIVCQIDGTDPSEAALTILSELHNRDKHASLGVVTHHILNPRGFVAGPDGRRVPIQYPGLTPDSMIPNGSIIFASEDEMQIEFEGEVKLAVVGGPLARHRPLPESFDDIQSEVEAVLQTIERNMP